MGLEDAWVLADDACVTHDSTARSPCRLPALRKPRTTRIVAAANANARAYHLSGLPKVLGHAGLRAAGAACHPRAMLAGSTGFMITT